MGTISRIALFVFLVVGLIASAEGPMPGTNNNSPFPRATPLPPRNDFKGLSPTEAARFRDERFDYYQSTTNDPTWNGQAVMGVGGAADQYTQCKQACGQTNLACIQTCDRQYMQSGATNTNQLYRSAPQGGSTVNGQVPNEPLRQPASFPTPRERVYFPDGTN